MKKKKKKNGCKSQVQSSYYRKYSRSVVRTPQEQAEMRPLHICFTLSPSQDNHVPAPQFDGKIVERKLQSLSVLVLLFCSWQECGRVVGPCYPHQSPLALSWDEAGHDLPLGVNIPSMRMDFRGKGGSCLLDVKAWMEPQIQDSSCFSIAALPSSCLLCPDSCTGCVSLRLLSSLTSFG